MQKRFLAVTAWVFALTILMPSFAHADEAEERTAKIRSALLYYLVKFVSFPSEGEHSEGAIKICLFGKDPINSFLKDIVSNKTAQSRGLEVEHGAETLSPLDLEKCEVNFFGSEVGESGLKMLRSKSAGILSVCAVSKITWGRCMVQIFEEENKAKLAIDLELLQAAGLKVSSELLEVSLVRKASSN